MLFEKGHHSSPGGRVCGCARDPQALSDSHWATCVVTREVWLLRVLGHPGRCQRVTFRPL